MKSHSGDESSLSYLPQLDGLRGLAVLMVLGSHWLPHAWQLSIPWGNWGVQLFFVLSGFLITRILLQAREVNPRRGSVLRAFYVRRILRIFPAYYVTLAVLVACDVSDARPAVGWYVLHASNLRICLTNSYDSWLAHFWSLAVEEQFYLLWPWAVVFLGRGGLVRVAAGMIVLAPLFRVLMKHAFPELEATVLMPSAADALGAGALLAVLQRSGSPNWYRELQCLGAWPVFVVLQAWAVFEGLNVAAESIRQTAMVVSFATLVELASRGVAGPIGWCLSLSMLRFLGKISYGIYLVHNVVPLAVRRAMTVITDDANAFDQLPVLLRLVLLSVATLAVSAASWFLLERPIMRLKSRIPYAKVSGPAGHPSES